MIALVCALLGATPQVDASVTVGSAMRRLAYHDRVTPTLADWQSGALAVIGVSVRAYPATGRLPVIDDLGVYGWYQRSLSSSTFTADQVLEFSTQMVAWEAGVRFRSLSGSQERFAFTIGYGNLRQIFGGARLPGYIVPAGAIQYWKPGAEGQVFLGPVALGAGAAYLFVVRQDFLSAFFPRGSKGGVEASVRASIESGKLGFTLSGRYQRFFYSLNPEPYDPYVAGGALDELFAIDLACRYRF